MYSPHLLFLFTVGKSDRKDESSDGNSTTKEKSSDGDDDVKAVKSCDEYEDGLSSNSNSSHKDQCSIGRSKCGPTSRISSKFSDEQLARYARDELKLREVQGSEGTLYWEKGKVRYDDIKALRRHCIDNDLRRLNKYLEAVEQVVIFKTRSV